MRDTKSPRLRDADSISGPIRLCGAADPVELRLRNNTDIGPHIVATNADIPEFDAYFAGGFDEEASPLGAKGLGKLTAAASAAPAIADAVCHATGKRIRDLPVAAELLHAMPYDGMQNTYAHDQKERSPCLDQSNLTFSCLAVGRAASLSLGTWRNRDDGLPSLKDVGSAACMPSKNEISSARVAHAARGGRHYGTLTGSVTVDMATVRQRKREMVDRQIAKHLQIYRTSGAELIMGSGRFLAPKTLEVKLNDGRTRVLSGDKVFLNVGTHAALPDVPGLEAAQPLTHVEALDLDYLPQHLIVIGGGYSGLELAQAYRRFGSHVTVVESGPQIMAREDIDVSREMLRIVGDEGIEVLVEAKLLQVRGRSGDKVTLTVRARSGEQHIEGSDILVAAGRIPNTAGIGLEEAGVELDRRDYIRVNDRLETSAPEVWALGECAGSPQFTHISEDDFRIIRDNLAGGNRTTRDRLVPYCMFTDPPLAHVGLSEGEAERQGVIVRVAKLPMDAVLGAQATDQREGFMKTLVGDSDGRILGFTMIGAAAGEVMAVVQTAMLAGLSYSSLADADFAHPTMAEGLSSLFSSVPPRVTQQAKSKVA